MIIGSAGFLAIANPILAFAGRELTVGELACAAVVTAGATVFPDLDHPKATINNYFGPVFRMISHVIAKLCGGHRQGTHSILAIVLVVLGSNLVLDLWPDNLFVPFLLCFFFVALPVRMLITGASDFVCLGLSVFVTITLLSITPHFDWMPIAIGMGWALHLVCDAVTRERVPLLWPVSRARFGPGLIDTGGRAESALCAAGTVCLLGLIWMSVCWPLFQAMHPEYFDNKGKEKPLSTTKNNDEGKDGAASKSEDKSEDKREDKSEDEKNKVKETVRETYEVLTPTDEHDL